MSVCFTNEAGAMVGLDLHTFYGDASGLPKPVPYAPHVVGVPFFRPWGRVKNHADVTMDGWNSFEAGADFYLINHFPLPVDIPHAVAEPAQLINLYVNSGAKLWMGVFSVKIGDGNAATCLFDCTGSTSNCNDPCDLPSGYTFNLNSVVTQPTPGDYAGSFAAAALDVALGWGIGALIGKGVKAGARQLPAKWKKRLVKTVVESVVKHAARRSDQLKDYDAPGKATETVGEAVQQLVDGMLQGAP